MKLQEPSSGNETQGYSLFHRGIDYGHGNGFTVKAAASGKLTYSRVFGYGLRATIVHSDGTKTTYSHLAKILLSGNVSRGEDIAVMGDSGVYATGVHLHFEYWVKGTRVNPASYFTDFSGGIGTPIPVPPTEDRTLIRRKRTTWLG